MHLGFQQLKERITTTQLRSVPSIIDIIGCDCTIDDVQSVKQELINHKFDLNKDVNKNQTIATTSNMGQTIAITSNRGSSYNWDVSPLLYFCRRGNLLIVRLLFLIGADCTQLGTCDYLFPMLAAAQHGHLDICKWLFVYGGDAKYQINKEAYFGQTLFMGLIQSISLRFR